MKSILKRISENSINFYIEKNLDDFYNKSSSYPNFISHIEDKISWVKAKNADWPEAIFKADFENYNIENEISRIKRLIQEGTVPNGWTVGPLTKPDNLGVILEENGFSNVYQQAGMVVDLKDLKNQSIDEDNLVVGIISKKFELNLLVLAIKKIKQLLSIESIDFDF